MLLVDLRHCHRSHDLKKPWTPTKLYLFHNHVACPPVMPFSALIQTSELGAARIIGPRTPARICTRHGFPGRATSAGRHNCTASGRGLASLARNSKPSQLISSIYALTVPKFLTHQAMSSTGRYTTRMKGTCAHQMFFADIEDLYYGNKQYMASMSQTRPGLLASLALEGQSTSQIVHSSFPHLTCHGASRTPVYASRLFR